MTAATPAASSRASCYVSNDRQREWKECCAKAMGLEELESQETFSAPTQPIRILNLMEWNDTTMEDADSSPATDHWMDNAQQIAASLTQMSEMIAKNRRAYVSAFGDLTEEEASVLESTVLSFSATAANQIDSLREAIPPLSADYVHHCSGIVAVLMLRLRHEVANPMASLQKQRTRPAMAIFQQPLSCRLVLRQDEEEINAWDQMMEDDEEGNASRDQRFLPRHAAPSIRTDFISAYSSNQDELASNLQRPPSLFQKKRESSVPPPSKQAKRAEESKQLEEERLVYQQHQDAIQLQESYQQELQREAVLLEASLQNELDSVYQVEQRMTDITALLSQFSALVSEQQEEIVTIHQSTLSSKENVSKGQESLVDAKERTKRSKHYMATFVWSIAILLLFFNYITP